jgi:hypothetical protein
MPASLDRQLEDAALERLRQRENPFATYVATLDEDLRYDVPEILEGQRRDINGVIDLFREGNRASQVVPILGDPGTGKTHLLASLKREMDNDRQLFLVSEGFPKERDPADFFLWQIVSLLLARKRTSIQILNGLSNRVTARLLGETLRRMPPGARLDLVPSDGFLSGLGRKLGVSAAVDEPLKRVQELLDVCETDRFLDALPVFWDIGGSAQQVFDAVSRHLHATESSDADGYLRRTIYGCMVSVVVLNRPEGLTEFLTGGFNESPEFVEGAGDLTKRLLRVLLEIFATFQLPVVVAFDQLEDFLRAGAADVEKELKLNFCRGLVTLTNAVPSLCILLFAERGLWNDVLVGLDQFSQDRLYKEIGLPGRPSQREISLPDRFNLKEITAIVRTRVHPALGDFDKKLELPASFPFDQKLLSGVLDQTSLRGCLQQLCKSYAELVFSENGKGKGGPSPREIHEYLSVCWNQLRVRAEGKLEDLSAADIPAIAHALKVWLDFWTEEHLTEPLPWIKNDVLQRGHELFGHVNIVRTRPRAAGLGIGFWLAEGKHRPNDLAAKLGFLTIKPAVIRRMVILRRDGTDALGGVSAEHFKKAENKGHDVRVESLLDEDLATILGFPVWLKAATAFVQPLTDVQREAGNDALKDIVRERTSALMAKVCKWLGDDKSEESPS